MGGQPLYRVGYALVYIISYFFHYVNTQFNKIFHILHNNPTMQSFKIAYAILKPFTQNKNNYKITIQQTIAHYVRIATATH
jgi:hypothetical protein